MRDLIERLAVSLPSWDAGLVRDLLDVGEVVPALEVLAAQLFEVPHLHHPALEPLREQAAAAGLAAPWLALLDEIAARPSTLAIGAGERPGGRNQTARPYRDLLVDGTSLCTLAGHDLVPPFGWASRELQLATAACLAGRASTPELEGGRAALLVCPECADLGCGALSARIDVRTDLIVWSELGFQTHYDRSARLVDIGPFRFERTVYLAVVAELRASALG